MLKIINKLFILILIIIGNISFAQKNNTHSLNNKFNFLDHFMVDSVNYTCFDDICKFDYYYKNENMFTIILNEIQDSINSKNTYDISYIQFLSTNGTNFKKIIEFHTNKILKFTDNLTESGFEGPQLEYYNNGELKHIRIAHKYCDTLIKSKFENGLTELEIKIIPPTIEYLDTLDTKFGAFKFILKNNQIEYNPNEKLNKYFFYLNSAYSNFLPLNGTFQEFYKNGNSRIIGQYTNNLRDGKWYFYSNNGKLIRKEILKNGNVEKCKPCKSINDYYYLELAK